MTKTLNSILISLLFFMFLSCENDVNSKNDEINDRDISKTEEFDDDEKAVTDEDVENNAEIDEENCKQPNGGISNFATVTYEEDKCANPGERTFKMLHLVEPADHPIVDSQNPEMICSMTIDSIVGGEIENFSADATIPESDYYYVSEKQKYTDISGTSEGEKCWNADRYTIRFNGYDKEMFIDSMIGKKITFYTIWSYWGMAKVAAVSHEDGTWIALNNVMAEKFGLKPETIISQSGTLKCTTLCVYGYGLEEGIPNYTIQPPVEFRVDGDSRYVLTRNGESVFAGGYEFYSDFSVAIADEDPDGIFTVEADYDPLPSPTGQFYFSILNIDALK